MSNSAGTSTQHISLPKGGGALQGIGEKFSPDLHTGTGNFSVPIALPPGRNGFQPQLSLVYSTGNGNGPFGLGWSLSVPGVARKTSHGVPRYDDATDTFILSGSEDLVPVPGGPTGATRYRPRTEGLFARIDYHRGATTDYWEVASRDGLFSRYGTRPPAAASPGWRDPAAIVDPDNPSHVFAWELTETTDPFGNRIEYRYERDAVAVDGPHKWDQVYLSEIRYVDYGDPANPRFLVRVRFAYEERPDPFSDYRSGFEVRTVRRCTRITISMQPDAEILARTYHLIYLDQRAEPPQPLPHNGVSLLSQVRVIGHDGDRSEALPPLEFTYTTFEPERRRFEPFTAPRGAVPDRSLGQADYELVDLFGNGLPSVLQMNGVARFWRNRGGARFDPPRLMTNAPAGVHLADPGVQFVDADGDGRTDLLVTDGTRGGYFPLSGNGGWDRRGYVRCPSLPTVNLEDPEVRLVDLDGDGITDALRTGTNLELFFNDRQTGWSGVEVRPRRGSAEFPDVSFGDPRVKLADINGDGLQDIVLVQSGRIDYWPACGRGRWGRRISMRGSPRFADFAFADGTGFDPKRLHLADVDGDGVADLIYVGSGRVTVCIGQSGNGWSKPITLRGTPSITDLDAVRIADMHGTGTAGILWTYDLGAQRDSTYKFLDLTGGVKPYLLSAMDNHLGAVTRVGYAPSTRYYLDDEQRPETRWRDALPFPVQVVARVEVIDQLSGGKLTTEYRYHHGYWDGVEREFRGFGLVDQFDTESFDDYNAPGLHGRAVRFRPVGQDDPARFSPPILTRSLFHQGPVGNAVEWVELGPAGTPWGGDPAALPRSAATAAFLASLPRSARRDAIRCLRGQVLRTELYALDGSGREGRPYTVTEYLHELREEDPPGPDQPGRPHIFFPYHVAERTTQWERGHDPQTRATFTGGYDAWGQPTEQTSVALPRRKAYRRPVTGAVVGSLPGDEVNEPHILAAHTRTTYATPPVNGDRLMVDRVAQTRTVELREPPPVTEQDRNNLSRVLRDGLDAARGVHETFVTAFKDWKPGDPLPDGMRLTAHTLHHYDGPAFTGLAPGQLGDFGALTRTETLTFVADAGDNGEDHLEHAYGDRRPAYLGGAAALPNGAPIGFGAGIGYRREARSAAGYHDGYYADTVSRKLDVQTAGSPQRRGVITGTRDALGNEVRIDPDAYWLLPTTVTDAAGLTTSATYDQRFLLPATVTDANGHVTTYAYSPLGLLETVVLAGGTTAKPDIAYSYDFHAYDRTRHLDEPQPIWIHTTQRVWHARDGVPAGVRGNPDDLIESREYSDGFGRQIQKRAQADDLLFGTHGDDIGLLVGGKPVAGQAGGQAIGQRATNRVVVSSWQVHDNKGRAVERYEPFLGMGWNYQPEADAKRGRHATLHYDPRGQLVRTINPDGSEQRLILGTPVDPNQLDDLDAFEPSPWEIYTYDANDLAPLSKGVDGTSLVARVPATHHYTPGSTVADALGRVICQVARNGHDPAQDWFVSGSAYDGRGNLLTVRDTLGRAAFTHAYDLQNRLLAVASIDSGRKTSVLDAAGNLIEFRDDKGAVSLRQYDRLNRLTAVWARDADSGGVTLRERLEYGDGEIPRSRRRHEPRRAPATSSAVSFTISTRPDFSNAMDTTSRETCSTSAVAWSRIPPSKPAGARTGPLRAPRMH